MNRESAFLCLPQDFKNKFLIYPPKIKDITSKKNFYQYRKLLTISQEEIEDDYTEQAQKNNKEVTNFPTPYEFLLLNSYHNKDFEKLAKEAFYFFTRQEVSFLYDQKKILIGDLKTEINRVKKIEQLVFLEEEEYFYFQNELRVALGEKPIEPPNPKEHPKIKRMKAKARLRDRIKAKQGLGINFLTSMATICCMGIGITPLNIGEMSYAALGVLMQTYQEKEKYQIDVASLQAGADSKKVKPKYWIRNLE